jgi:secreted PhoX family phosphatase
MKNTTLLILVLAAINAAFAQNITYLNTGSSWKYLDNGSNQGTAWRSTSFSDATWKTGNSQLGYGDGDEATVVSFGPKSSSKYITTYFRRAISIADLNALSGLTMRVKRDDGIIIYINGTQRYINNMPTGTITSTTRASTAASDDGNTWLTATMQKSFFVTGNNTIAVEIHQSSSSSSDISFDMELIGLITAADVTPPTISARNPADNATNIAVNSNLTLTFNELIQKGTGSILIKENGVQTQSIAVTGTNVSVSGNTLTIDPANFGFSKTVNIEIPSGVIRDLAGNNFAGITTTTAWDFTTAATVAPSTIGTFTSIRPTAQTQFLVLPSTHTFQFLLKEGSTFTVGGTVPTGHDFTGYIPNAGSSTSGYVHVNHENSPGGVSQLVVNYNTTSKLWQISSSRPIPFNATSLVKTERNCSGGITPWGTSITSEETRNTGDANGDGYIDVGWHVEIDPVTASVKQYGNGKQEKLWAMGRMSHENVVVSSDQVTAYYGEDATDGCVYKFVATTPGNLYNGELFVLKLNSTLSGGEPTSSVGTWVKVPNTTASDRNNAYSLAISLGGTQLNGVEDVEIGPDGKVYFTSKGNGRVYRFTDNGTTLSNFETYVGGRSYTINYGTGSVSESWGTGNDNLAFDDEGNLWVNQDGGRGHLWVVRNGHTQASPRVELFATTPAGSESTGLTFTPDKKFAFVSFQHPSTSNQNQVDAAGVTNAFNRAYTVVIARKENLGGSLNKTQSSEDLVNISNEKIVQKVARSTVYPNPTQADFMVELENEIAQNTSVEIYNIQGKLINTVSGSGSSNTIAIPALAEKGMYIVIVKAGQTIHIHRIISQ